MAPKVLLVADGDPKRLERFRREVQARQRLRHPGIVAVHEAGLDPRGRPFLAMELVRGESLDARVAREGPLPASEVLRLGVALARAVACAHAPTPPSPGTYLPYLAGAPRPRGGQAEQGAGVRGSRARRSRRAATGARRGRGRRPPPR